MNRQFITKNRHFLFLMLPVLWLSLTAMAQQDEALPAYLDNSKSIDERVEDALRRMTLKEKINVIHGQSTFSSKGVPRLGIPDFWTDDGPHGVRPDVKWYEWDQSGQTNDSCVAFPALTCLAATWSPRMAYLYGRSVGEEALYRHKNMILGPGVNILRTPLGGRNFEYMGEDPWLTGEIAAGYIRGMQSNGVSACVKHFCLNNDEQFRNNVNVIVSDRALHEIYLPAFKAAVEKGHVWAVMGSYNLYKNEHNSHNRFILRDILKDQWHFDGVVVSDWGGVHNTEQAVENGLDMEFGTGIDWRNAGRRNPCDNYYLADAYRNGILQGKYSMASLDEKVRRVLRLMFRTSMAPHKGFGSLCSDEHYAACKEIGEQGIVLLKNEGDLLPLNTGNHPRILVVGENAIKMLVVGGGSSSLKAQREVTPLPALQNRLADVATVEYERGYVGDTTSDYNDVSTGQHLSDSRSAARLISDAVKKAKDADYVIVVGGMSKNCGLDAEGCDRNTFSLPYTQDKLIEALSKANKNLIYVNLTGNPVAMPWIDQVPAIVQGWYLGSEAGNALAAVLCGDVNPSGKLPYTWPSSLSDVGAHALNTYPGTWRAQPEPDSSPNAGEKIIDEEYKEGIYVGYRWADAHQIKPLFAFGHGLSYTTFELTNLRLSSQRIGVDDSLTVTVNIRNTGTRAGSDVVQLYIHDDEASVDRPYKELKGFQKIFLEPGEARDVSITIGRDALSFYDESTRQWTAEPGSFRALVGDASDKITNTALFVLKP